MSTKNMLLSALLMTSGGMTMGACGGDDPVTTKGDMATYTPTGTGPAAKLKCDSSGKNAFDTYGVNAFVAVNEAIFAGVTAELTANSTTNLGDSFGKIGTGKPPSTADNATTFTGKLAAFLVFVYGGPTSITYTDNKMYNGVQDMKTAHAGLAITSAQYDYFVTNVVVPALLAKGVKHGTGGAASPDDVTSCFAPPLLDASFKATIVGQ